MIVIIGAGPAGLSAAYHIRGPSVLIEMEQSVGGLCRSFDLAGASFDMGGHAFFTEHELVRTLVERLSEGGLYWQPRQAWVWSHGQYVRYPFQTHLYGLPPEVVEDCLTGVLEAGHAMTSAGEALTLDAWITARFGAGIARHFALPYNEKAWAFPLSDLAPDWCSERIVTPDIRAIVRGAVGPVEFKDFPNTRIGYPARGGFIELYRNLLPRERSNLQRRRVEEVNLCHRRVITEDGAEYEFDWLISTMPLTELVAKAVGLPAECRGAAARLRHNSLYLVNIVLDRRDVSDMQRVYVADAQVPFHKLVLNSNSSPFLRDRSCFALQAEVSWSEHKPVERNGLIAEVQAALVGMGLMRRSEQPIGSNLVEVRHAYPVYTAETQAVRRLLIETLKDHRVLCAGRFGEWLYINSDVAVMRGRERANQVNAAS